MSLDTDTEHDCAVVAAQLGRAPRQPWRVGARCSHGYPVVILSPSELADGTPFPSLAWLTCPWLAERVGAQESNGETARWAASATADAGLAASLRRLDEDVRRARNTESGGVDACESVGLAGQRDPLGVKCLHAHVALALAGFEDPIGATVIAEGRECADGRCRRLIPTEGAPLG